MIVLLEEKTKKVQVITIELTVEQARILHTQLCNATSDFEGPAVKDLRLQLGRITGRHS